ncbi:hypothetical protein CAPTEDRAFT_158214, partial [Capitella teleta]
MSERVQNLAASVYKEFERMISKYDEDVVKELMPIVVGILENLDLSFVDKQEQEVELELLRDDNEQLLTQYEREKQLRKSAETKCLEVEDVKEEELKELTSKVESLDSIVRMFELKAKNAQDHITRLEDRDSEMKKEYTKLHDRYTDLFKTHVDYMERSKLFIGGDKIMDMGVSPRGRTGFAPHSMKLTSPSQDEGGRGDPSIQSADPMAPSLTIISPVKGMQGNMSSLKNELGDFEKAELEEKMDSKEVKETINKEEKETAEKEQNTEFVDVKERSTATKTDEEERGGDEEAEVVAPSSSSAPSVEISDEFSEGEMMDDEMLSGTFIRLGFTGHYDFRNVTQHESSIFDELSAHDTDALGQIDDGADITGMSKEVENLILENTELLATKNALNIVKDDLIVKVDELSSEQEILREEISALQATKEKLKTKVSELEDELKKTKELLEKEKAKTSGQAEEGEEDIPMAQRKRFTRVEMARVLMERNQYKERLMELQEAVRWTEMIRASREHPDLVTNAKKKSSIWNFFSNLFSTSSKPPRRIPLSPSAGSVKYRAPTSGVQPLGDPNKKQRDRYNIGEKSRAYDFLQDDLLTEKARREREKERREQYKQVRAHVKKDDGRMQAYGWSLPAKFSMPQQKEASSKTQVPVPVPVYCRPLMEDDPAMKLWCAAGVNLSGGKTRDGGSIVGASVFYSDPPPEVEEEKTPSNEVEKLDQELKEHEKGVRELLNEQYSSLVWICTTTHSSTKVTIVDANNPATVLESFHVTSSHILCISSVPGAMETDYPNADDIEVKDRDDSKSPSKTPAPSKEGDADGIGSITMVTCATGSSSTVTPIGTPPTADSQPDNKQEEEKGETNNPLSACSADPLGIANTDQITIVKATGSPAKDAHSAKTSLLQKRLQMPDSEMLKDGLNSVLADNALVQNQMDRTNSVLPTMWMGSQSGSLYVHSAVSEWKKCLHSVKLKDSVLSINHIKGRVFVALADGNVAVFHRAEDGQWDLTNYHVIDLGKPYHSVRCMCVVGNKNLWCGYMNKIHILDPKTLQISKSFDAHPRRESQVRQLAWLGDGVWVSIRLDSTLRLYHAYTHQHLQDVDIEPYVSKMLGTGKLGFSFVRITSLLISCNRLWIGTGNGVVISVPLSESNKQAVTTSSRMPGGVIRVYSDNKTESVTPGSFVPYCSMAQAQLSFHGHRDAVKFFVAVPGSPTKNLSSSKSSEVKS